MTTQTTTLLVLGGSGDLSSRLLLPALGQLLTREPRRKVQLLGAGMDDWDDAKWRRTVRASFDSVEASGALVESVLASTAYRRTDISDPAELTAVFAECTGRIAVYFAVPPAVAAMACQALESVDIPEGTVLALEKPFGVDQASAHTLNEQLAKLVPEEQIHRVDHFLGRSTVLNILGVRFANRVLEPTWSAEHIESVTIRFDEKLGLEGRAGYYDKAGALTDMIQSHLLQILAVVAMDPPATLGARDLQDAKAAVLRATSVWDDDPVANSRRGRYTAGKIGRRALPAYVDEPGVDPKRNTETLAEVTLQIDNARWAGVPFTLRSGKALHAKRSETLITFKPVSHLPKGFTGQAPPSLLRLGMGPDNLSLELNLNGTGDPFRLSRTALEADLGPGALLAYGEVLSGLLDSDPTLSVRGDTAEQCWRIVQPVLDAWHANKVPLEDYAAGTAGPAAWTAG